MRILIIPSWYPTEQSPVNGIFVREQAVALSSTHSVGVLYLDVLPRTQKRKPRRYSRHKAGFEERVVEVRNLPVFWQFLYVWQLLVAFRAIRRDFRPDVVHCHVAVPAGL